MARDRDGWEYTDKGPRWAPTVEIQMANILDGKHGDEYDEAKRELDDLVRAAQRDAAEKLYEAAEAPGLDLGHCVGLLAGGDLIFPDYPEESGSE